MTNRVRAGTYRDTEEGYRAFHPFPVPDIDDIVLDREMLIALSNASISIGKLDGISGSVPEPDLFVMMYIKKEAVLSSQIEGTQASLMDVLEYEGRALDPNEMADLPEVLNHISAMRRGVERIGSGEPLDLGLIRDLHRTMMRGGSGGDLSPGEFRTIQNWIGPKDGPLNDAVYVPPPPDAIKGALENLESYIGRGSAVPPLIKAALSHVWFESIHPFLDGNGRVGRLLITLILHKDGVLSRPLLYLSHYFKRNRSAYYDRLQAVRERDDIEGWLGFFLKGVSAVSVESHAKIIQITVLRDRCRKNVMDGLGQSSAAGMRVLDALLHRPVINVNYVMEVTGLSYPSANKLTGDLMGLDILSEVTGNKRNRVFEFKEYMDILER